MERKEALTRVLFLVMKLFLAVVIVFCLYTLGQKAYQFGFRVFAQEAVSQPPGKDVAFVYEEGTSPRRLADMLADKGLVQDANVFYVQLLLSQEKDKLQPGNYVLNTSYTPDEILKVLAHEIDTETEEG